MGPKSLHSGQISETYFRNAAQLYTLGESVDNLSIYIALTGLQHAGVSYKFINFILFTNLSIQQFSISDFNG